MKTIVLKSLALLVFFLTFINSTSGQVPQGFNYMAVARNFKGEVIQNMDIIVTIGILSSTSPVIIVWEEEHQVKTNNYGIFQLVVGDPLAKRLESSTVPAFSDINWQVQAMYLRVKVDAYEMGTSQLFSVPYAMVSGTAYSGIGNPFEINGDTVYFTKNVGIGTKNPMKARLAVVGDDTASEDALFEVRRKDGETMFAVYNQGVRINVPLIDNIKGIKGGFAIGGFSAGKGVVQDLFSLNKDSVRFYVDKTPDLAKGKKGGFAIGGFDVTGKAVIQEYLSVTPDSTRIYIKDSGKTIKGGFAIGGFNGGKGNTGSFLNLTRDNYLIGHESGIKINGGLYNSFMGYQAGYNTTTGSNNYIIGYRAGYSNISGFSNIFIGDSAGFKNTTGYYNSFIGNWSGFSNIDGFKNVMIGFKAGYKNTSGQCNVFVGPDAGGRNTTAWYNTFVGIGAGYNTTYGGYNSYYGINSGFAMTSGGNNAFYGSNSGYWFDGGSGNTFIGAEAGRGGPDDDPADPAGNYNTVIGSFAGENLANANNNVLLGYYSGATLLTGSGNVFIGYNSGKSETGSNKLFIENSSAGSASALIYGEFDNDILKFNARVGVGKDPAIGYKLDVNGDINLSAGYNFKINGTNIVGSPWATVTNGIRYNSGVGINASPDATNQLKVGGNAVVSGDVSAGSFTGNLNGKLNGMTVGKIFLEASGGKQTILSTPGDKIMLLWDPADLGNILIRNNLGTTPCNYWFKRENTQSDVGGSGEFIGAKADPELVIIAKTNIENGGLEIHFGRVNDTEGWCSVWLQYYNGIMVGHYIMY